MISDLLPMMYPLRDTLKYAELHVQRGKLHDPAVAARLLRLALTASPRLKSSFVYRSSDFQNMRPCELGLAKWRTQRGAGHMRRGPIFAPDLCGVLERKRSTVAGSTWPPSPGFRAVIISGGRLKLQVTHASLSDRRNRLSVAPKPAGR